MGDSTIDYSGGDIYGDVPVDDSTSTDTGSTGGNDSTIDYSGGDIYSDDNSTTGGGVTTSYQDSWWDSFKNQAGNFDLSKLITGAKDVLQGGKGTPAQLAALGGIAALINKYGSGDSGTGGFAGYQGGIPSYTASRTMNPIPTTVPNPAYVAPAAGQTAAMPQTLPRRPGSGGITYFTPQAYTKNAAAGGMMSSGGISSLGDYSDGGRLLKGPGDGVSDSIPARIGEKQEARLADGEFVVPARIVSELGNGSTEAGARKLYAMMDRIQHARKKSMKNVAADSKAEKMLPA